MYNSVRKTAMVSVTVGLVLSAGSAVAQTHYVLIHDRGFFPAVTYLQPGDKVQFTNEASDVRSILGDRKSWKSGNMSRGQTFTYPVDNKTPLQFVATGETRYGEVSYTGEISFAAPPLSE
ncbi:MAG: cupredoxin domain-containing protein [Sulfitobacter sp.]|uniref:cupredoxin domain-containing protein n=1 Tax=Sulfitobacter sp. TaxID=1903071 RepID=UPI0040597F87